MSEINDFPFTVELKEPYGSTTIHSLNDLIATIEQLKRLKQTDSLEVLKQEVKPFINELQSENHEEQSAGITYDYHLETAYNLLNEGVKKMASDFKRWDYFNNNGRKTQVIDVYTAEDNTIALEYLNNGVKKLDYFKSNQDIEFLGRSKAQIEE